MASVGTITIPDTQQTVSVKLAGLDAKGRAASAASMAALTNVDAVLPDGSTVPFTFDGTNWVATLAAPTTDTEALTFNGTNPDGTIASGPGEIKVEGGPPVTLVPTFE